MAYLMERDNRKTPITTTTRPTWIIRVSLPSTESRTANGNAGLAELGAADVPHRPAKAKRRQPAAPARVSPCRHHGLARAYPVVRLALATRPRRPAAGATSRRTSARTQRALEVGVVLLRGGRRRRRR